MRIRRRPPQIPAPASSDPAAGGGSSGGAGAGEAAAGGVPGKGEILAGSERLHPSIEARGKNGWSWGGDSVSWKLEQPAGGVRGGRWTGGGSDASCYGEAQQQKRHKGKAAGVRGDGAEQELDVGKDQKPGAAQPAVLGAHKAWNHIGAGGLLRSAATANNSQGAEAFVSAAAGAATGNRSEPASTAMKRKNIAWSAGGSRSARSPSSSASSIKAEISHGGIASYMHSGDHEQLAVKDEEAKKGEVVHQQQELVNGGGSKTGNSNSNNSGKRRRSPAVLMEGSRCSRVNGRGWRCCQQTLVGYSLCEHHLGKGRLRSVTSVRCKKPRPAAAAGKLLPNQPVAADLRQDKQPGSPVTGAIDEEEEEDERKPPTGGRRGKRIGIVKARSISSLLDQTSSDAVDPAGAIQEAVAAKTAPTATSALDLLAAAVARDPAGGAVVAAMSLPPPPAAHQEGINA